MGSPCLSASSSAAFSGPNLRGLRTGGFGPSSTSLACRDFQSGSVFDESHSLSSARDDAGTGSQAACSAASADSAGQPRSPGSTSSNCSVRSDTRRLARCWAWSITIGPTLGNIWQVQDHRCLLRLREPEVPLQLFLRPQMQMRQMQQMRPMVPLYHLDVW